MKLHIFDNALINKTGHNFEYIKSIYCEWQKRRVGEAVIYSNINTDKNINEEYATVPLFIHYMHKSFVPTFMPLLFKGFVNILIGNYCYFRDLNKLDRKKFNEEDILIVPVVNQNISFAICLWYHLFHKHNLPYLVLFFRSSCFNYTHYERHSHTYIIYKMLFKFLDMSPRIKKIWYTTDSEDLANEYRKMTKKIITVLPIPHTPKYCQGTASYKRVDRKNIFTYIGDARDEKGFYLLPDAISMVLSKIDKSKVQFIIQSNLALYPGQRTIQAKIKLSNLSDSIMMIDKILESNEYYDLMFHSDAILIPYRMSGHNGYYARTSGIFTEALALAKPVIVTKNTWMERQLFKYQGGGVAFEEDNCESLANAMIYFIKEQNKMKKMAVECSKRWVEFHNAKSYLDILISLKKKF